MLKSEASGVSMGIDFNMLTKFIKTYDGDRSRLAPFLTNCNNAMQLARPEQQDILFKFILSQLEGKAEAVCSLKYFKDWPELKSFLKSTFGEVEHRDHLLLDLQTCKMKGNEDVSQFSLRLESCLTRLQTDITHSTVKKSELEGRIASTEDLALHTFLLGLPTTLSTIVRCRNPQTLNEAIDLAIQEEKLQNYVRISRHSDPKTIISCNKCGKTGHPTHKCFLNQRPIYNIYRKPLPPSSNLVNSNNSNIIICNYCKNPGHDISNCRKRQYNNTKRQLANSSNSQQRGVNFIGEEQEDCNNAYNRNSLPSRSSNNLNEL